MGGCGNELNGEEKFENLDCDWDCIRGCWCCIDVVCWIWFNPFGLEIEELGLFVSFPSAFGIDGLKTWNDVAAPFVAFGRDTELLICLTALEGFQTLIDLGCGAPKIGQ